MTKHKQKKAPIRTLQRGDFISFGPERAIVTNNFTAHSAGTLHIASLDGHYAAHKHYRTNSQERIDVPRFYKPLTPGSREDMIPDAKPIRTNVKSGVAASYEEALNIIDHIDQENNQ